jgi:hypothetical protein
LSLFSKSITFHFFTALLPTSPAIGLYHLQWFLVQTAHSRAHDNFLGWRFLANQSSGGHPRKHGFDGAFSPHMVPFEMK